MPPKKIIEKSQMIAIHNAVTDEIEGAKVTIRVERDKIKHKEPYTVLFQAVNYATAKNVRPVTAKLLLYLCSVCDYENIIHMTTNDFAQELGYSQRNVQIALKELEEYKIITRTPHPQDKRSFIIILNPLQSWKGQASKRLSYIQSLRDKNQLEIPFPEFFKKEDDDIPAALGVKDMAGIFNNFENENKNKE
jgi:DNA-binding MarR family transcriptional regulator